jgi:hypothetical protein
MIRPFQLRDLALVHRLGERGAVLQAETALTSSRHPLRSALIHMLVGGRYSTYVWKSDQDDRAAFVQLRCDEGNPGAYLTCLGASSDNSASGDGAVIDADAWLPVLDELVALVGSQGVHSLVAEVSETGPELPVLRRAGFAVYTRQDVWLRNRPVKRDVAGILVPREPVDDWDIHALYSSTVPRLIQAVEPNPPLERGENWVLRESGELTAFAHIRRGPVGSWMRLLVHPNAHTDVEDILEAALVTRQPDEGHPVYCCVQQHQSWLQAPLEAAGFELWGRQAVMVKHIAQRVVRPAAVTSRALDGQTVAGSSPVVQSLSQIGERNQSRVRSQQYSI